jgi:phage-related protein
VKWTTLSGNWTIEFFKDDRGVSHVEDFLSELPSEVLAKVYNHIRLLREFGLNLKMPHAKPLKGYKPFWELRPFPIRLFYFAYSGRRFIILHAFQKRTDRTPKQEIAIAKKRYDVFIERENK